MHPIVPLLQLVHTLRQIEGRKRLQKMVHILQELGFPFKENFEYSLYGMYSQVLKNEVQRLAAENLVREKLVNNLGNATYLIEALPDLDVVAEEFGVSHSPPWGNLAQDLNRKSPQELECISTILFLRRTERDDAAAARRLLALKPHLASIMDRCFDESNRLAQNAAASPFRRA